MIAQSPKLSVMPQIRRTMSAAELGDLLSGPGREVFRGLPHFAGKDDEELSAAARTEENAGESQLRQQRARQDFAQKSDPLRPTGEQIFAAPGRAERPSAELARRNSSVPRILPCSRICSGIEAEKP